MQGTENRLHEKARKYRKMYVEIAGTFKWATARDNIVWYRNKEKPEKKWKRQSVLRRVRKGDGETDRKTLERVKED